MNGNMKGFMIMCDCPDDSKGEVKPRELNKCRFDLKKIGKTLDEVLEEGEVEIKAPVKLLIVDACRETLVKVCM